MLPLIGLTTTYSHNDQVGGLLHMGVEGQSFHVCTDDFVRSVTQAGGIPVLLPTQGGADSVEALLSRLDGLILCGGPDLYPPLYGEGALAKCGLVEPDQDQFEIALARSAFQQGLPILGVCRGLQVINVALGGSLYQDLASQRPQSLLHSIHAAPRYFGSHRVRCLEPSNLSRLVGPAPWVNSYHHQAVKRVAPPLRVVARAEDEVIEALDCPDAPAFLALQWHPEMMADKNEAQAGIFRWFLSCAQKKQSE